MMSYVAFALVLVVASGAWAATPTDALRGVFAQADRILTDPETDDRPWERLLAIRKLVNDALDFREASALAFGRHWQSVTPAEQQEFTQLLADMLERSYISRLAAQASLDRGANIQYLGETIEGSEAFVWTTIARRNGGEILLGYRMIERGDRWKVRDVIIDGVSVAGNYRAQIERVLEGASVPELLVQMREKAGRAELPPRPATTVETAAPRERVAMASSTQTVETGLPAETVETVLPPETEEPAAPTELVAVPEMPTPMLTAAVEETSPPMPVAEPVAFEPARAAPPAEKPDIRATPTPPRAATRVTKAYWLRLGTVQAIEESGRLAALLEERKLVVSVEPAGGAVEPLPLSVRVGPFQDATEAVLKLLDLQTKGHDPVLVAERE